MPRSVPGVRRKRGNKKGKNKEERRKVRPRKERSKEIRNEIKRARGIAKETVYIDIRGRERKRYGVRRNEVGRRKEKQRKKKGKTEQ
jgi:hypothetical protein